jgi:hypothetical protein
MKTADQQIDDLRAVFPEVQRVELGGLVCALIPELPINTARGAVTRNAILYPYPENGYPTRLYLDQAVDVGKPVNWQERSLRGAQWWARSWNFVPADISWFQILAAHMRAFQ